MARFDLAIPIILKHEGGFVDNPSDPGGATKFGVSLRFLVTLQKKIGDLNKDGVIDRKDIVSMTESQAKTIYETQWWDRYGYGNITDQAVATKIFDMAVNMGASQAHKIAQRALTNLGIKVDVDGQLGPKTVAAINKVAPNALLTQLRIECANFYKRLVAQKPSFKVFERGWLARAAS